MNIELGLSGHENDDRIAWERDDRGDTVGIFITEPSQKLVEFVTQNANGIEA